MPEEWRVMQVLQTVDCYDGETSRRHSRLTLRTHAAAGHNVFFLKDYYEGRAVVVSRAAAELMLEAGVRGAEFVPVAMS